MKKNISDTSSERNFNKLIRKLENKLWLDKQIAQHSNPSTTLNAQADAVKNFRTRNNALSVFIADDADNINRILAAIAAGSDKIYNADYAIFDADILDQHQINYEKCPGETPDTTVNELHVDLKNLTAHQICLLTQDIQNQGTIDRVSKRDINAEINKGLAENYLKRECIRARL